MRIHRFGEADGSDVPATGPHKEAARQAQDHLVDAALQQIIKLIKEYVVLNSNYNDDLSGLNNKLLQLPSRRRFRDLAEAKSETTAGASLSSKERFHGVSKPWILKNAAKTRLEATRPPGAASFPATSSGAHIAAGTVRAACPPRGPWPADPAP